MTPEIDQATTAAGERYDAALLGLKGTWSGISGRQDPLVTAVRTGLRNQSRGVAKVYLKGEEAQIEDVIMDVANKARESALHDLGNADQENLPELIRAHLSDLGSYLKSELSTQISRDIRSLETLARNAALKIDMTLAAENITRSNAIIKVGIEEKTPEFKFRDRMGRTRSSRGFIMGAWRQALVSLHVETKLRTFMEQGVTRFVITHPDKSYRHQGVKLSITFDDDWSYEDLKTKVFHPNSRADIKPILE